jgi:hypothetical protein
MTRARPLLSLGLSTIFALSCAGDAADSAQPAAPDAGARQPAAFKFENPGGMWMPAQMAAHADTLKQLGVAYDPNALTDPTAFPLGAVVSLGGCSASFVSADGLLITNHHCVTRYLQHNSTPEQNLLKLGYLARTRADEKSGGPTARVFVTTAFTDVTDKVLGGLEAVTDGNERYKAIEERRKQITNTCEAGRPEMHCSVASYFEGAQFFQIEQIEVRDVRLVYAPAAGIGNYGGEVDNWRWPRHTGDFSFLRAYVGKDGKPADFAADNVPYAPKHHLKVAREPIAADKFVMVAGYPGRTQRLKTAAEAQQAADWYYARQIALYEQQIATLEGAAKDRPDVGIKTAAKLRNLHNYLTNFKGMRDGLAKGGVAAEKARLEGELQKWIDADAGRKAKYGDVLAQMAALTAEKAKTREHDMAQEELLRGSTLLGVGETLVKLADEREKPDAERKLGYQERDAKDLEQGFVAMESSFSPEADRAVLRMFLQRAAALPEAERPEALAAIVGKDTSDKGIEKALDGLYKTTRLGDAKARVELLKTATPAKLRASKDPFVKLALKLKPIADAHKQRQEALAGSLSTLRPRYIEALRAFSGGTLAPDANSTLRITFGTVRGYTPPGASQAFTPFTRLSEVVAKSTGEEPFAAPPALIEAVKARKFGPYVDATLGEVPVDFLADLDITGGNSGSATLNARGELTGLVFDGNIEAMASDWVFLPAITRSIHVDIRYVLWVMDAVDQADHLLTEMGVTPAI